MNMGTSKSGGLETGDSRDFASLMDSMRREAQGR